MKKLLRPQDRLLLGMAYFFDALEEIKDPLNLVGKAYENYYGFMPSNYKKHKFRNLVWRNLRTGNIEKIENNGQILLRLTSKGTEKVKRDFPLSSLSIKKWDKKWRIVIFDVQEKNKSVRDKLRRKLKELYFGALQKSVYITPHDILKDFAQFIEEEKLNEEVILIESKNIVTDDIKKFANKIWKLEDINNNYKTIIEKAEKFTKERLTLSRYRVKKLYDEIKKDFVDVLMKDPHLPKDLLPKEWLREKTKRLVGSLSR